MKAGRLIRVKTDESLAVCIVSRCQSLLTNSTWSYSSIQVCLDDSSDRLTRSLQPRQHDLSEWPFKTDRVGDQSVSERPHTSRQNLIHTPTSHRLFSKATEMTSQVWMYISLTDGMEYWITFSIRKKLLNTPQYFPIETCECDERTKYLETRSFMAAAAGVSF